MGLEWDPEGDAERDREKRRRLAITVVVVLAVLGFIVMKINDHENDKKPGVHVHVNSLGF